METRKCRWCGKEIPNDKLLCEKCEQKFTEIKTEYNQSHNQTQSTNSENSPSPNNNTPKKSIRIGKLTIKKPILILIILFSIALISGIGILIYNNSICSFSSCNNLCSQGSPYCYKHTCRYPGCTFGTFSNYCDDHTCKYTFCNNGICDDSEYCYEHKCVHDGCKNKKGIGSDYCINHQVDMRNRLKVNTFWFSLNSVGGIKLHFEAENISGKEIKYINFPIYLYNAVGDSIESDFGESKIDVEIVGVIHPKRDAKIDGDIIGYCERVTKLVINNVTITYTDGTQESGHLGYSAGH